MSSAASLARARAVMAAGLRPAAAAGRQRRRNGTAGPGTYWAEYPAPRGRYRSWPVRHHRPARDQPNAEPTPMVSRRPGSSGYQCNQAPQCAEPPDLGRQRSDRHQASIHADRRISHLKPWTAQTTARDDWAAAPGAGSMLATMRWSSAWCWDDGELPELPGLGTLSLDNQRTGQCFAVHHAQGGRGAWLD